MSVNSQRCWMLSFFPFLIWIGFYTRIRDTAESPRNRRSSRGATLHGSAKRNANVAVRPRTDAGSSREHTPGSTVFESCLLDMRSWLIATKPWFVLLQQSSVGGKLLLFTDRFLMDVAYASEDTGSRAPWSIRQIDGNSALLLPE